MAAKKAAKKAAKVTKIVFKRGLGYVEEE